MSALAAHLLWLKAFHVIFVVTWFAGLFYLPRLFVYHATTTDALSIERFKLMERRLYIMMNIGMGFTLVFAVLMLVAAPDYLRMGWLHTKMTLVMLLIGYHLWCGQLVKLFAQERNPYSERWYRGFNEVPGVLLIAIVILAVVKPF